MVGGWFVGAFEPTCLKTAACEVAYKQYEAGTTDQLHMHRVATELTLIAWGRALMNGQVLGAGDIVVLQPGEAAEFEALEATATVVVKLPSVGGDKYLVGGTERAR